MEKEKAIQKGLVTSLDRFLESWNEECKKTEQLFDAIPASLWYKDIIPGYRTLARLAWHLTSETAEMLKLVSVELSPFSAEAPQKPDTIVREFKRLHAEVDNYLRTQWTDATLDQVDSMYGESWTRSMTVTALLFHLCHHRAQMTVLLRAGGAAVPGMYGPAKEEWATFGMASPE